VVKKLDLPCHLLMHAWFDLSSDPPPTTVHQEPFGRDGAFRAGPPDPGSTSRSLKQHGRSTVCGSCELARDMDRYCFDNALAVFRCASQTLHALNKHVDFGPS
jgi:hypothetical protein